MSAGNDTHITADWLESIGWDTSDEFRPSLHYWLGSGDDRFPMKLYLSAGQAFLSDRLIALVETQGQLLSLLSGLGALPVSNDQGAFQ